MDVGPAPRERSRDFRGRAAVVQVSDFSLGRGKFLASALRRLGLQVVTLTNAPVYQTDRGALERGSAEVRVPFAKALYGSVPGRLVFYIGFSALVFRELVKARPNIVYSRGPYPFTEITAQLYRLFFRGTVVVSDTTDLWPDSIEYVKMNPVAKGLFIRLGLALSRVAYRRVDQVVTHNEPIARVLRGRFHRPTTIVYGAIDMAQFGNADREEARGFFERRFGNVSGKFVVAYAGLLGPYQNPGALVEVAKRLDDEVVILVAGKGPLEAELRTSAESSGVKNLVFLGTLPFDAMPALYGAADVCILTYPDLPFLKIGLPKKFIEYAASRRPVLCMAPDCVAKDLCREWEAGIGVGANDFDGAADAIRELRADPGLRDELGRNGRRMAQELFSEEVASRTLGEVLADAEGRRGG